jgi:hypothetical protein
LAFSVASGAANASVVTATFTNQDNKQVTMTGTLVTQNPAVVKFAKADGLNSSVISGDLSYTLQDSDGAAISVASRGVSMSVGVAGSIPNMREGDLTINGVIIGPSTAADDTLSPRNNASGSAIAKAAAINRMAVDQGISQGEAQSITLSGTPMPGTITVGGVSVVLTNDDNTAALAAAKIAAAMRKSDRSVEKADGSFSDRQAYKRATQTAQEEEKRKAMGMKKGGSVGSASKRADGCAQRGKTRGKMV